MDMPGEQRPDSTRGRRLGGAAAGVLAAGVALGVAELAASLVGAGSSPVVAVGGVVVDATPAWLKDFAIRTFGAKDKLVLITGVLAALTALAAAAGALAVRRTAVGLGFVAALAIAGATGGRRRVPPRRTPPCCPSLAGGAAGAVALLLLLRPLRRTPVAANESGKAPNAPNALDVPAPRSDARGRLQERFGRVDRKGSAYDRRSFLIGGAVTATVAAGAGAAGRSLLRRRFDVAASREAVRLPAAASRARAIPPTASVSVPGVTPFVTANGDFYRVDTALVLPQLSTEDWRLRIHGMVDREIELDFAALQRRRVVERDITLTCVSNEVGGRLAGTARWTGTPLADLLREAGVRPGADQLLSRSIDGMTIGTPIQAVLDGRDALLAYGMNGEALPVEHGFPVRMVVPGLYGYVSATKWVVDLEVTRYADVDAYWTKRKWARIAPIKTFSRIDAPKPLARLRPGRVAVAGVAWAQHRGIRAVEVRVDGGPWQQARLATDAGLDLWRQWVWEWDAAPGTHRLEVRATDATGAAQPERRVRPFPDGATGWHSIVVTVG
jgi:DMSO/TMAO reductase YedYZ molybdopterin-dependent catalytic subunit